MNLLLLLCTAVLSAPAFAGGVHAGIDLGAVPTLGPVERLGADVGVTAPVHIDNRPVGVVRLYVSDDAAAAGEWFDQNRAVQAPGQPLALGDRAFAVDDRVAGFIDGNVALTVALHPDAPADAVALASDLHARIADQPAAWPAAPTMAQRADGLWTFQAADGSTLTFVGGRQPLGERDGFSERPLQVTAWDRWSRATVLDVEQ